MEIGQTKFVRFDIYCKDCKYQTTEETDDPCNECLAEPVNEYSKKPVCFKKSRIASMVSILSVLLYG